MFLYSRDVRAYVVVYSHSHRSALSFALRLYYKYKAERKKVNLCSIFFLRHFNAFLQVRGKYKEKI